MFTIFFNAVFQNIYATGHVFAALQIPSQSNNSYLPVGVQSMMSSVYGGHIPAAVNQGPMSSAMSAADIPDSLLTSGLTDSDLTTFLETHKNIASLTEDILAHLTAPCKEGEELDQKSDVEKVKNEKEVSRNEILITTTAMSAEQISNLCKNKGEFH